MSSFDSLPRLPFAVILRNIAAHERVQLELVSKKWSQMMPYDDCQMFDTRVVGHDSSQSDCTETCDWPLRLLDVMLCRIGQHLLSLNIKPCESAEFRIIHTKSIANHCYALEDLSLFGGDTGRQLQDELFGPLIAVKTLRSLSISSVIIVSVNAESLLSQLISERLESLKLNRCAAFPFIRSQLLKSISVEHVRLDQIDIDRLCQNCPNLMEFAMKDVARENNAGGYTVIDFATPLTSKLTQLCVLRLSSVPFNNDQLDRICHQFRLQLQTLILSSWHGFAEQVVTNFSSISLLIHLRHLDLSDNEQFLQSHFELICQRCLLLEKLSLHGCASLCNCSVALQLLQLRELDVSQTTTFDPLLFRFAEKCWPLLNLLNAARSNISSRILNGLVQNGCQSLQIVDLANCYEIDDSAFVGLLGSNCNLQQLDLRANQSLTDAAIWNSVANHNHLNKLLLPYTGKSIRVAGLSAFCEMRLAKIRNGENLWPITLGFDENITNAIKRDPSFAKRVKESLITIQTFYFM